MPGEDTIEGESKVAMKQSNHSALRNYPEKALNWLFQQGWRRRQRPVIYLHFLILARFWCGQKGSGILCLLLGDKSDGVRFFFYCEGYHLLLALMVFKHKIGQCRYAAGNPSVQPKTDGPHQNSINQIPTSLVVVIIFDAERICKLRLSTKCLLARNARSSKENENFSRFSFASEFPNSP